MRRKGGGGINKRGYYINNRGSISSLRGYVMVYIGMYDKEPTWHRFIANSHHMHQRSQWSPRVKNSVEVVQRQGDEERKTSVLIQA